MPREYRAHAREFANRQPIPIPEQTLVTDISAAGLHRLVSKINNIARSTGDIILQIYSGTYQIETKSDQSPVTCADMAADSHIQALLEKLTPDFPVLSEESAKIPYAERTQWETYWLVDPLDGTREFIKGNGEFSVNIALIHKEEPILGVVYAPVMDDLYFAYRAGGAWKQSTPQDPPTKIHVRKPPNDNPTVARSRSRQTGPSLRAFLDNLGHHEVVNMGSALKSCLVAEGVADLYPRLGPTSEWDTGAAQCIVTEAGGNFTDTAMRTLRYNTKDSLTNPPFFVCGDSQRDWSKYLETELH